MEVDTGFAMKSVIYNENMNFVNLESHICVDCVNILLW